MSFKIKYIVLWLLAFHFPFVGLFAQPEIEWEKSLGGNDYDHAWDIKQTPDGGYIIAGNSRSDDGDISNAHGMDDIWVIKLSALGEVEWEKSFGGSDNDRTRSVDTTIDGGYIVAGYARSSDGDVILNYGESDVWIIKLSSSGSMEWQKTFGGSAGEEAYHVHQTSDFGYIVCGVTSSSYGDISSNENLGEFWILQLDELGDLQWESSLGGSGPENANSVLETADGYVVAGYAGSIDGDVSEHIGPEFIHDFWIMKLDLLGNLIWNKCLGGSDAERPNSIIKHSQEGFVVAGWTKSDDGDVSESFGDMDVWVIHISEAGELIWEKSLGGSGEDGAWSLATTSDGGIVVLCWSESSNEDVSNPLGNRDSWLVKLSSDGVVEWEKSFGGSEDENCRQVEQTSDGGLILAGSSNSPDGDVSSNNGTYQYWIVKLSADGLGIGDLDISFSSSVHPNPASDLLFLSSDFIFANSDYRIVDVQGRISQSGFLSGKNPSIDISQLVSGVYYLTTPAIDAGISLKFVKL